MGAEITWTEDGMWAWIRQNGGTRMRACLVTLVRKVQKEVFIRWASMSKGSPVGFAVRFSERGFSQLNLTPRSKSYQKHQQKYLGKLLPYTSPDGKSGTMRGLVLGGGYAIRNLNGGDVVTTQMSVTGANQLNQLGAKGAIYRQEFLAFDRGGKADAAWIQAETNKGILVALKAEIERATKSKVRAAGTGA